MPIAAKLDELGDQPDSMILGFIWWWPVGLMLLAFMTGSGRKVAGITAIAGNADGTYQDKTDCCAAWRLVAATVPAATAPSTNTAPIRLSA